MPLVLNGNRIKILKIIFHPTLQKFPFEVKITHTSKPPTKDFIYCKKQLIDFRSLTRDSIFICIFSSTWEKLFLKQLQGSWNYQFNYNVHCTQRIYKSAKCFPFSFSLVFKPKIISKNVNLKLWLKIKYTNETQFSKELHESWDLLLWNYVML